MGALVLFLLYTAFLAPQSHTTFRPQLPRDEPLGLPRPPEQIAGWVDLPDGYHKRVRAYMGTYVAVAMLDTGSFRNCIDEEVLKMLEAKQRKGELGEKPVTYLTAKVMRAYRCGRGRKWVCDHVQGSGRDRHHVQATRRKFCHNSLGVCRGEGPAVKAHDRLPDLGRIVLRNLI